MQARIRALGCLELFCDVLVCDTENAGDILRPHVEVFRNADSALEEPQAAVRVYRLVACDARDGMALAGDDDLLAPARQFGDLGKLCLVFSQAQDCGYLGSVIVTRYTSTKSRTILLREVSNRSAKRSLSCVPSCGWLSHPFKL